VVVLARGRAALLSLRSRCAAAGTPILYSGVVVYTVSQRFFVGALICAIQLRYLFTIREIDSYLAITDALLPTSEGSNPVFPRFTGIGPEAPSAESTPCRTLT
jgi:hypothetical protein